MRPTNDYPNSYTFLPISALSLEIAHPLFVKYDEEELPLGSQEDIDNLKAYNEDGSSTGAFMSIAERCNDNTGGIIYTPSPDGDFFEFKFELEVNRKSALVLSEIERIHAQATSLGLVQVYEDDYDKPMQPNNYLIVGLTLRNKFLATNPTWQREDLDATP